jgi:adenylate cyclase
MALAPSLGTTQSRSEASRFRLTVAFSARAPHNSLTWLQCCGAPWAGANEENRMAERADIVDIDVDPLAERARRRRMLLRVGLPLGGVGLIVGFLFGITVYTDAANRAGVLILSNSLLQGLQRYIALEVSAYLVPAERAILLAQSLVGRGGATLRADDARAFATAVLTRTPQVENMLFADGAGNFQLVTRAGSDVPGGIATKLIRVGPEGRRVEWLTRNRAGAIVARRSDPADTFDARNRGWFTGARAGGDVFWTNIYIFFSARIPGVTAAVHGPDDDPDVIGIDIKLDELSRFLGSLSIGRTGRAYIVSPTGEMIAGPDPALIMRQGKDGPEPVTIDDVGDADLAAGWDHFRVQGPGSRIIEAGGRRLISIATPLAGGIGSWLLIITVPEAEFSGFVAVNAVHAAELSLIVILLALGLAVLLVRQGLRADRADRAVAERAAALARQSAGFARLAQEARHFDEAGRPPPALTETLAEATRAQRASLWRLVAEGSVLHCEDGFEPATDSHTTGLEVAAQEVPLFMAALARGEEVDVPDARRDARTAALHASLMGSGVTRLLAVPVVRGGRTRGVVMLEEARLDPSSLDLARACAALIALGAPTVGAAPDAAASQPVPPQAEPRADGQALAPAVLAPDGVEESAGRGRAAALVLRLPDALLARYDGMADRDADTVIEYIARVVEEAAEAHRLPYAKMLGGTVVAAAGLADSSEAAIADAASRLADAAITLRERCLALFANQDDTPAFGVGLDVGPVHAVRLANGDGPVHVNLWGAALRGAETLAETAPAGTIQASEQAYRRLRQHFVFRPRGNFHRPGIGDAGCYLLAGRA